MLSPEKEREMSIEHYNKYDSVAKALGIDVLIPMVLNIASEARIRKALAKGDEHLNTIPLRKWDFMVGCIRPTREQISRTQIPFWSLAAGVCTLKHVAKYYIANLEPPK